MDRVRSLFGPLSIVFLIFIALLFFLGLQIASRPVRLFGKAADSGIVDPDTSSIWSSLYTVKVGGSAIISVFLRNSENRAVGGKSVQLNITPMEIVAGNVSVSTADPASGEAKFTIGAKAPGRIVINAVSDNITLSKNLTLEFIPER